MTPKTIADLDKAKTDELLDNWAKNWLAHDGLWFQAVEKRFGIEAAIALDAQAWEKFTVIEAERIKALLGLPDDGGLDSLELALNFRLYAKLNRQASERVSPDKLVFRMIDCRVQSARRRKGLADFPCKPVGVVEYGGFAKTIDPRIETRCVQCPPDKLASDQYCVWEFTIPGKAR